MNLPALLAGAGLGASLIIAIGAQNAFVLRQGLLHRYALRVAAVCVAVDWTLIIAGAVGFGALVERFPALVPVASWGGAAFLIGYGALAFRAAVRPGTLRAAEPRGGRGAGSAAAALGTALAVSLLNPHVYLDTVVLLGSIASRYEPTARAWFVLGAGLASSVWFFGLALGARLLAPVFERETSWRVLDTGIGCIMWWIAGGLIWQQLAG